MQQLPGLGIAANWTSAAGALESVLSYLGAPLPRHAIMGLTPHAWRLCLGTRDEVVALPSGVFDTDRAALARHYERLGWTWDRFGRESLDGEEFRAARDEAIEWAVRHLDAGRPVIAWDLRIHEYGVLAGYDRERRSFLVEDILSGESGQRVPWDEWANGLRILELLAPMEAVTPDPIAAVRDALSTALDCFAGLDGPPGQPRGTAALDAWAGALASDSEVDRAGNAYTLAVLQAARSDGIAFLDDLRAGLPDVEGLGEAAAALRAETRALAPLLSLFPFPAGGHGGVTNAGLRRVAADALRQAADHERAAVAGLQAALAALAA